MIPVNTLFATFMDQFIGSIQTLSTSEVPSGYLLCDGQEYLKIEYPKLYSKIGDVFGNTELGYTEPSSEEYFRVPNLLDRFLRNTDGTRPVGTNQTDTMRKIVGTFNLRDGATAVEYNNEVTGAFRGVEKTGSTKNQIRSDSGAYALLIESFDSSYGIEGQEGTVSPNVGSETAPLNTTVIMVIKAK